MNKEIERKWLLTKLPENLDGKPMPYERHFLFSGKKAEVRIQKKGEKYEFERKYQESELSRDIQKFQITKDEYNQLEESSIASIERESYLVKDSNISVNKYGGRCSGLIRAEIEFGSEEEASAFIPLDYFGIEITDSRLGKDKKLISLSDEEFQALLETELALSEKLMELKLSSSQKIIKIDGRGGSGKSTLARRIASSLPNSIHINLDEYTVDETDLFDQVNIDQGFQVEFKNTEYGETGIKALMADSDSKFIIIEGCFSFKNTPDIQSDIDIWVEIDKETAKERLNKRESEDPRRQHLGIETIKLSTEMWQKSEDEYISEFKPWEKADLIYQGNNFQR